MTVFEALWARLGLFLQSSHEFRFSAFQKSFLALLLLASATSPLKAELPAVKLMTAPLVAPSAAWTYYGSGTTHTTGTTGWTSANRPAEIKELARALGRSGAITGDAYAAAVADYVRDNIQTEFRFGLSKGARGAIIDQSGTAFDQAHLMVELLRENGATATYQVGTITLNASQFYDWAGLTNAAAACQYLADGGIPATVNGASTCTGLTGNVSTVTMGHIWVSTGGKLYDPAYKKHIFKSAIDLAAAMGCGTAASPTCGSTILGLVPATTSVSGVQRVTNVPEASINTQLKTYAVNLQNWIQNYSATNNTVLQLDDVIGGKVIDRNASFTAGANLPYVSSVQYSWSGDIPDQYRTTLRVQMDSIDQTLFVDEMAGKRLRIWGQAAGVASYSRTIALYAEYKPLAKSTKANATPDDAVLTLTANHPYAANGGAYLDEVLQRSSYFGQAGLEGYTAAMNVLTIVNGWGDSTESTVSHFGGLQSRDLGNTTAEDVSSPNHLWLSKLDTGLTVICISTTTPSAAPVRDPGCRQQHQSVAAATWLAQTSRLTKLVAQISGVQPQLHHTLGYVLSGEKLPFSFLNVETGLSAASTTMSTADRNAAYLALTASLSRLEGSVFEQQFDSWDGGSSVSFLVRSNRKLYPFLWVDSTNVTTALNSLSNYSASRKAEIQSYVSAGFSVVVPQNGYLGDYTSPSGSGTMTLYFNGTVAFNSAGDRVAYMVPGTLKGATAASGTSPSTSALNSVQVLEYSLKGKKYFDVNLGTAELTLSPPPDIVTGAGEFPMSLQYRRYYNSRRALDSVYSGTGGGEQGTGWTSSEQTVSPLGGGWSHNFDISAKMDSDGFKGLGRDSAQEASAAIAALYTAYNLGSAGASFRTHLGTIFTMNWGIGKLANNVVIVNRPPKSSVFTRLPDDVSFSPEPGSSDVLVQVGARQFSTWLGNGASCYTYNNAGYLLTASDGTATNLAYENTSICNRNVARVTSMTFSNGIKLSFAPSSDTSRTAIASVSNSLGRSLSLDSSEVDDEIGRKVLIRSGPQSDTSTYTANNTYSVPKKFVVTAPDNLSTIYEYASDPAVPVERAYPKIVKWYTPSNATTPYATFAYDPFYRVKNVTDNLSHARDYFVTGLYGSENEKQGALKDPLGNVSINYSGGGGKDRAVTDPLGRTSKKIYDAAGRVIREINPEGDAVEYQYDVRSNRTRECRIAKGRVDWTTLNIVTEQAAQCNTALGDLVQTTVYVEGPAVWACANAKICNRPAYVIDANGNRTDYSWSATHGQLLTETTGLNSSDVCALSGGVCPTTTYGYTAFTGTDGAIFYLLTSKQEKIDATATRTTTWGYNGAAAKFTLKEQVVDSGGLSLRTCFKFDATGNLISKTEPRANLASCP